MADTGHAASPATDQSPAEAETKNFLGRELPYRALYLAVGSILVVCVVFALLLLPMVRGFSDWSTNSHVRAQRGPTPAPERPAGPLLQSRPEDQLIDYEREIDREVESYGWVDESAGIARIPIALARDLVLREGLGSEGATPSGDAAPVQPELAEEGAVQ